MPPSHLLLALVAAGSLLAAACSGDEAVPTEAPTPPAPQAQSGADAPDSADDSQPDEVANPDPGVSASVSAAPAVTPALAPAFGERIFERPVDLISLSDGRSLVAEQHGVVLAVAEDGSATTFLDIGDRVSRAGNEEGLLSIALDPADPDSLWVYYSVAAPRRSRLSRFTIVDGTADPNSELVTLDVPQPFSNHNGGAVRFGPDGMLYLGLGDGGAGGDPEGNGQDRSTLLGAVLRIDVQNASLGAPYVIPADNPFVGQTSIRPEIWAYGLRNPWRMSFDVQSGRLWLGDVGQGRFEEIDIVERGTNLGWNVVEGDSCFDGSCNPNEFAAPIAVYSHDFGCSVTGGVVVRRSELPFLDGAYVYGDFCSGQVWTIDADLPGEPIELLRSPRPIAAFAKDLDGNVYVLTFGGAILQFVAAN